MTEHPRELKPCQQCGTIIPRRRGSGGKMESWGTYAKKKFCSRKCVGLSMRKSKEDREKEDLARREANEEAKRDKVIIERLGSDWLEWGNRVERDRGFDPLGFYRLAHTGEFLVQSESSSGEGVLGLQPFKPRISQDDDYLKILEHRRAVTDEKWRKLVYDEKYPDKKGERLGRLLRLKIKARRFGATTGEVMRITGDGAANRGFGGMYTSYAKDGLDMLSEIIRTALGRDKEEGKAKGMAALRYETNTDSVFWLKLPSDDFGRGGYAFNLLLTEADYIDDVDAALDSIMPAVSKSPLAAVTLESTIRSGATTGFKNFVRKCLKGESAWQVEFLGWMQDDTAKLVPTAKELKKFKAVKAMNAATELDQYILKLKQLGCTPEQFAWWWQRYLEDARESIPKMVEMYPSTVEEALDAAMGDDYYTEEGMKFLEDQRRPPVARYVMNAEAEPARKKLPADADHGIIPHMRLWYYPQRDKHYYMVCDPGTGKKHGGDNFAVMLERETGKVMACFQATCSIYQFANALVEIGYMYGTALIVVENNKDGGLIENLNIRLKYPLAKLYHMEKFDRDDIREQNTIGFTMTRWSRQMAMDALQEVVNEKKLICPDSVLYDQLVLTNERRGQPVTGNQKMIKKDDGAICLAIGSLIRNYSRSWPSRTRAQMYKELTSRQENVDTDLRESETSWTSETYNRFANQHRLDEARQRILGG